MPWLSCIILCSCQAVVSSKEFEVWRALKGWCQGCVNRWSFCRFQGPLMHATHTQCSTPLRYACSRLELQFRPFRRTASHLLYWLLPMRARARASLLPLREVDKDNQPKFDGPTARKLAIAFARHCHRGFFVFCVERLRKETVAFFEIRIWGCKGSQGTRQNTYLPSQLEPTS